jgi:hypothetical protein
MKHCGGNSKDRNVIYIYSIKILQSFEDGTLAKIYNIELIL